MTEECSICCEKFNHSTRKKVCCPFCNETTCVACLKNYLLNSEKDISDCMFCKAEFSLDFIATATPKTFHNQTYRKKRADNLLSHERSLLPNTQPLAEAKKVELQGEKQIRALREEESYLRARHAEIRREIIQIRRRTENVEVKKDRRRFIMGCPLEDCRGFLSQAWKCGTCDSYICAQCRMPKEGRDDQDHHCNADDVATTKLLNDETKPCPNCAVLIYKISGCDQMWCIECHTLFSWNTGQSIHNQINHNPEFYRYQRATNNGVAPRVPGDIPLGCQDQINYESVERALTNKQQTFPLWATCHRLVGHIRHIIIPRYPVNRYADNSDLRVAFLLHSIDEKKMDH